MTEKKKFAKNVAILMSGTIIAQAIPVAVSPILTRIYSPEDFGILALYISIFSIFAVIATMRYEFAILQPVEEEDAEALVALTLFIVVGISVLSLLLVFFYNLAGLNFFGNTEIGKWLYLIPVNVFFIGVYQVFSYWQLRADKYGSMASSKVIQGASNSAVQVGTGLLHIPGGLVFGQVIGQFFGAVALISRCRFFKNGILPKVSKERIFSNACKYKNLPVYSSVGALADSASLQMPVFFISNFFGQALTGIFGLTFRILALPISLVSSALSQVLYKKIADMAKNGEGGALRLVVFLFFSLLLLMVPFCLFFWNFGEDVFGVVFGEAWRQAGSMASILAIAIAIRFAVSPLSTVLVMEKNVRLGTTWQVMYLITISTTLYFFRESGIDVFLWVFVIHEIVLYLLYFLFILIGVRRIQGKA